ncbi:MAG: polysaccharide biosynthesis/export family protein [Parafilimonas sp.]|nr:polysaccharide biosynthesis/export family protein [Parafilimonas sp.]
MKINFRAFLLLFIIPGFVTCFTSCNTYKNVAYFQDFADTAKPVLVKTVPFSSPVIQTDDILSVTIQTIDNDVTNMLNSNSSLNNSTTAMPVVGSSSASTPQGINGYLVDKDGNIEVPFVGKVHVAGLTTAEAKNLISGEVNKYFNDAIVNVRYANFKITVIGEVLKPSTYVIPNEKINIFDALALAGDMTIYGQRENVLLVRDTLNDKRLVRLNLNNKDIISSPYFYLQSNDIVYVQPNKQKVAATDAYRNRLFALVAAVLTVVIVSVNKLGK